MTGETAPRHFLVWGEDAVAQRLVTELTERYSTRVTVIVPHAESTARWPAAGDDAQPPTVLVAPRLDAEVFRRAGLTDAAALALVRQDDVANVDAALIAREVNPTVRIVLRMFNPVLGEGVTELLGDCAVLSGSEIAAPAFVAAALGDPTYVRLAHELLVAARRDDVADPRDVLCGIAVTGDGTAPVLLPADGDAADLVLARTRGAPPRARRRPRPPLLQLTRLLFGRKLRIALTVMAALLVVGTATVGILRGLGVWQSVYLTVLTALGGAEADLDVSAVEQVITVLLVIAGVALIPVLTGLVVDVVVNARLKLAVGGLTGPIADHVIVVGLGNLGTRVIKELHGFGVDVVAVDSSTAARGVEVARQLGIPVVIGSANRTATLRAASVETCRALVVLSKDDVANLETALLGRAAYRQARPAGAELRVVLRLFDEDFAARVQKAFRITLSRSVSSLVAPAFAAAMVGREVVDTIAVGRRVLLVAELPVGVGSELEGRYCPDVDQPGEVRLVAVRTGAGRQVLWSLPERRPLLHTDRLVVVATRAGLASLVPRTTAVPHRRRPEPRQLPLLDLPGQHPPH